MLFPPLCQVVLKTEEVLTLYLALLLRDRNPTGIRAQLYITVKDPHDSSSALRTSQNNQRGLDTTLSATTDKSSCSAGRYGSPIILSLGHLILFQKIFVDKLTKS